MYTTPFTQHNNEARAEVGQLDAQMQLVQIGVLLRGLNPTPIIEIIDDFLRAIAASSKKAERDLVLSLLEQLQSCRVAYMKVLEQAIQLTHTDGGTLH